MNNCQRSMVLHDATECWSSWSQPGANPKIHLAWKLPAGEPVDTVELHWGEECASSCSIYESQISPGG